MPGTWGGSNFGPELWGSETLQPHRSWGHARSKTTASGHSIKTESSQTNTTGRSESATTRTIYYNLAGERELAITALQRLPTRRFFFSHEPLADHLLEAPLVPDELYSYAAIDLPAELMAWQRADLEQQASISAESSAKSLVPTRKERWLAPPKSSLEMEIPTATPQPLEVPAEDVVDAQVVEKQVDPEDPFLD